jgi:hypothetical protein
MLCDTLWLTRKWRTVKATDVHFVAEFTPVRVQSSTAIGLVFAPVMFRVYRLLSPAGHNGRTGSVVILV